MERDKVRLWLLNLLQWGGTLALAAFIWQVRLESLEATLFDWRVRLKPVSPVSDQVRLIQVDAKTVESLDGYPKAAHHARLLSLLRRQKAKAVIYFYDWTGLEGHPEELALLARRAQDLPVFLARNDLLGQEETSVVRLLPPLDQVPIESIPTVVDNKNFARDGVSRRAIVSFLGEPLLPVRLATQWNGLSLDQLRGQFDFKRTMQVYADVRPTGTYTGYAFLDVLSGVVPSREFAGRIVLIGRDTKSDDSDYVRTSFSRDILAMTQSEYQANVLDTFLLNRGIAPVHPVVDFIVTALMALAAVFVVLNLRPLLGLVVLVTITGSLFILGYLGLFVFNYWIGLAHPLVATFVAYYVFLPVRLIVENRRSWEYYQKNTFLTQVEELKSNFLKMMSHDLKTPLARIQGMADVIRRAASGLSPDQERALTTIEKSADELTHFISTILSLSRIESKEVKLHWRSKDVNSLLMEVIRQVQYLADEKGILIRTEFEPLFSVRMDEDLMRQVFSNLLENAIKYSSPGAKILVSTEEIDGQVLIQVADQGEGISPEDTPKIFEKFYRSPRAQKSPVQGSGLGLYLAKYFVELHGGRIWVESEVGTGSTFFVQFPNQAEREVSHAEGISC